MGIVVLNIYLYKKSPNIQDVPTINHINYNRRADDHYSLSPECIVTQ